MEPLIVTAHTPVGYCTADIWSPALEGILAYESLYAELGPDAFALGQSGHGPLLEATLPLGRESDGDDWWWQCSSPIVEPAAREQLWFHRRFDAELAVDWVTPPRGRNRQRVEVAAGPYKNYRIAIEHVVVTQVSWHCIGEPDAIRALLRRVDAIGARRGSGLGEVRQWTVESQGDAELARFHRPLPVAFAARHGRAGNVMAWGIRPPGRAHRIPCVLPL